MQIAPNGFGYFINNEFQYPFICEDPLDKNMIKKIKANEVLTKLSKVENIDDYYDVKEFDKEFEKHLTTYYVLNYTDLMDFKKTNAN